MFDCKTRPQLTSRRTCISAGGCSGARPLIWCGRSSMAGCSPTTRYGGSCTQRPPNITCRHARYLSWLTCTGCAEPSPSQGLFPPAHPRLRKRWFQHVLAHAAARWCVSSRGTLNPRMVKRRNTAYASHNRTVPLNQHQVCQPALLPPLPLSKRKWYSQAKNQLN